MRFVHGEQGDGQGREGADKAFALKPLGRDVDEPKLAARHAADAVVHVRLADRGIDERGGNLFLDQTVHLIFHERDERGDDHRDAFEHQGGQLVAERLAAARGHDDERVPALKEGIDHALLTFKKFAKAEVLTQLRTRINHAGHKSILREPGRYGKSLAAFMTKYLHRIEFVAGHKEIGQGKGGHWKDLGYEWYAGI